jgi:predicted nucleotidyltransferase
MATLPDKVRTSVEEFIRQLNANNLPIRQAYIFGSYAKGQQTEWSDIDLALVSDQFEGNFFYDRCKLSPYVIKIDTDIETHPFRPEDFTKDNPFVEEIIETGIQIA